MWNNSLRELWNLMPMHQVKWNKSPHAPQRISHCEAIFHARSAFHKSRRDLFRWKNHFFRSGFFMAPPAGLEPATTWLTVRCSANWAKEEYEIVTSLVRCSNPLADFPTKQRGFERKTRETYSVSRVCVGYELFSRAVASQVSSPLQRLTSVFGMGTGGPTALKTLTHWYFFC